MSKNYIIAMEERLDLITMRLTLTFVHPDVVNFMHTRRRFTLKDGTEFMRNDKQFSLTSANGKVVGLIQGLSGISPRKQVIIRTNNPELLDRISAEFFASLEELTHVIKHFMDGPVRCQTNVYTPMVVASPLTDNSTQNFIEQLNEVKRIGSTPPLPTKYSVM